MDDKTVYIFHTDDSEFSHYNGYLCQIKRALTSADVDLDETGPMYEVTFVNVNDPNFTNEFLVIVAYKEELEALSD